MDHMYSWNKTEKTSTFIPAPSAFITCSHEAEWQYCTSFTLYEPTRSRNYTFTWAIFCSAVGQNFTSYVLLQVGLSLIWWGDKKTACGTGKANNENKIPIIQTVEHNRHGGVVLRRRLWNARSISCQQAYHKYPIALGQSSGNNTNVWFSLFRILTNVKTSKHIRRREV